MSFSVKSWLKGPKHEIFEKGVFTQIRPVWVGDLGTRPKNYKNLWLGFYIKIFMMKANTQKNFNDVRKAVSGCFDIHFIHCLRLVFVMF